MGASSLKSLYEQSIGIFTILLVYSLTVNPVVIDQPGPALYMFFLCIFNGIATGTVFAGLKPWFPKTAGILTTLFQRANMIFSGKMFVASTLPASMLSMFSWNPLFHIIDQTRGFVFLNYTATATSWQYPLIVACVLLVLGLIGQNYAQKHVSSSRSART
jgi:ABC-type polysaccharide/polyol phosphate export permease